jgi:hypothetical protein
MRVSAVKRGLGRGRQLVIGGFEARDSVADR